MSWKNNAIMYWSTNNGATWNKITDHNRSALGISVERIETKQRMADGTLRRYVVAKKRTFDVTWDMLPTKIGTADGMGTVDDGWSATEIENFHNTVDGAFLMRIKRGDQRSTATSHASVEEVRVMVSEFSKTVVKRSPKTDFCDISITLEEV